jgi:hypothetical protein
MQLQQRINAFEKLGRFLLSFGNEPDSQQSEIIYKAKTHNGWFTEANLIFALQSWSAALTPENLKQWSDSYAFPITQEPKQVAIVMAGNIPLVGFHDFLSVLLSGHKVLAKLSSNDQVLLPYISEKLLEIEPAFNDYIQFTDGKLEQFDAVIATGSNNTSRYFEYYFGKVPNIIRKNRNSVAVLTGNESKEEMEALADDVFRYFGLGCRNVSKIYLPEDYNMDHFFNGMYSRKDLINNDKYINNYDYNKAVYLMTLLDLLDNEFMLLKEDAGFSSPISVVFYERYTSLESLQQQLEDQKEHIQCIISSCGLQNEVAFGKAQQPELWDYADGVDTIKFLLDL